MSYSVVIGGSQELPFTSISGQKELREYVEGLPLDKYGQLAHFLEWSWCQNLQKLQDELYDLLHSSDGRGMSDDVGKTILTLHNYVSNRNANSTTIVLTDDLGE